MTKDPKLRVFPGKNEIDRTAADWLLRNEEGNLTVEEQRNFREWRNQCPRHRQAYDRLERLWSDFDPVAAEFMSDEISQSADIVAEPGVISWFTMTGRKFVIGAMAASVLLFAGFLLGNQQSAVDLAPQNHRFATQTGEQIRANLPDGSIIHLNTDSEVEYTFSEQVREVSLIKGEAFFDVAHDSNRPFSVVTASGAVVAIGTAFTVRVFPDSVDVLVSEGQVALIAEPKPSPDGTFYVKTLQNPDEVPRLVSGQGAKLTDQVERISSYQPELIARKLSWRNGVLAFSGDRLVDVIQDVNRYSTTKILFDDPSLRDLPVSGYFRIGELDEMFEALELLAGLEAEYIDDTQVRLVRKQ